MRRFLIPAGLALLFATAARADEPYGSYDAPQMANQADLPYSDWPAITASSSGVYAIPRGTRTIFANCSTTGTLTFSSSNGNTLAYPVPIGITLLHGMVGVFTKSGTCTFAAFE